MKILHFEDEPIQTKILKIHLDRHLPGVDYHVEGAPYVASLLVSLDEPDVLICDYYFRDHATIESGLVQAIKRFSGPVYVYSIASPLCIARMLHRNGLAKRSNIKVFSKRDTHLLVQDLKNLLVTA